MGVDEIEKPCAVAYDAGWPIGWMLYDPIDTNKVHMFVHPTYRNQGIARKLAIALKKRYPRLRMGVYPRPGTTQVIKGLAKRRSTS
jgi:GNAT superfamily N-acetyltransferase